MKKIYGFAALCAAMTLASCSNNDEPVVNPVGSTVETQTAYLSVSLATPAAGTRALGDLTGYTDGEDYESDATSAVFAYFDASGNYLGVTDEIALDGWKDGTTETVEKYTTTLVKVEQPVTNVTTEKITYILAVVNCPANLKKYLDDEAAKADGVVKDNMEAMRKKIGTYTTTTSGDGVNKVGKFVMTNSAYGEGNTPTYLTSCKDNIYNSPGEAQNNPSAVIYVERVLSRVDAIFDSNTTLAGIINGTDVDDVDKTPIGVITGTGDNAVYNATKPAINIKVTGVSVSNVADQTYLVKDLTGNASYPVANWFETGAKRSHWATMPTTTFSNYSYDDIVPANSTFVAKGQQNPIYLQENTDANNVASILITAELCDDKGQAIGDLYRLTGNGNYYTEAAAKVAAQGYLQADGYRISKEAGKYESVPVADIRFVDNKNKGWDGHIEIVLGSGEKLYQVVGTTYTEKNVSDVNKAFKDGSIASINNALSSKIGEDGKPEVTDTYKYGVRKWSGGKCYYYKNIAVMADKDDATKAVAGIVRNHIYKLNLNSVSGFGIPVFDPTEDIIPNDPPKVDPEDDWYLNARINILQWGIYTQNVDFETPNE